MNRRRSTLMPLAAGAAAGLLIASLVTSAWNASLLSAQEPAPVDAGGELPPLVIDKQAPLLLDDASKTIAGSDDKFLAINDACFVCHANYKDEPLVISHAKADLGCIDCHGPSREHRNDEDNVTPPDIMYLAAGIDGACQECHDSHDAAAKDVLVRWRQRCPEKTSFESVVCTDCHGRHRLETRLVQWDKTTRQLIVRAVEQAGTQKKTDGGEK